MVVNSPGTARMTSCEEGYPAISIYCVFQMQDAASGIMLVAAAGHWH